MIIELPNGDRVNLENEKTIEEKIECVEGLIKKFESSIIEGWDSTRIKFFLNGLSNYICWHKEEKYSHDKEVLSKTKDLQMKKYNPKNINFEMLNNTDKKLIGLHVKEEIGYDEE